MASKRILVMAFCVACAGMAGAQQQSTALSSIPLPADARLRSSPLKVTLAFEKDGISAEEPLRPIITVTNTGTSPVHVRRAPHTNLDIYDATGQLVAPDYISIVDYIRTTLTDADWTLLDRGETQRFRIHAENHSLSDYSRTRRYGHAPERGSPDMTQLRLPPGRYSARVTYVNFPDYGPAAYGKPKMTYDIWEGKVVTEPVPFSVQPFTAGRTQQLLGDLSASKERHDIIALLGFSGQSQVVDPLLELFSTVPETRLGVMLAIKSLANDHARRLAGVIARMLPFEREQVTMTHAFGALAAEDTTCETSNLLVGTLDTSRGDTVQILGPAFLASSKRCPTVAREIRRLVSAPHQDPDVDNGVSLYRRARATELLGIVGGRDDVALFSRIMQEAVPAAQLRRYGVSSKTRQPRRLRKSAATKPARL